MDWTKVVPWNWFEKEGSENVPARASDPRSHDPFSALQDEMDRLFGHTARRYGGGSLFAPALLGNEVAEGGSPVLRPSVDIAESEKGYSVKVEIPGVEKDDLKLEVHEESLVIRGEKRHEAESDEEGYHCIERSFGQFQRTLSLPDNADTSNIEAQFKNGVVTIKIPKLAAVEPKARRIEIGHG